MNLCAELNIVTLKQNKIFGAVISASDMRELHLAEDIIQAARHRAAELLVRAREHRREQRKRFRRRMAQQRRRWHKQNYQSYQAAKEGGAKAALEWLVEQQHWEQHVYRRMTQDIAGLLAQRLREIGQNFPWETLLFEHLSPLCDELRGQSSLTLRVAPAFYPQLPAEIMSLPLAVETDETLPVGEAMLESPVVRVALKLPAQIAQISEALSALRWEQLDESD